VGKGKGGRMCRVEEKGEGVEGREEKALATSSEVLAARGQEGESAALESLIGNLVHVVLGSDLLSLSHRPSGEPHPHPHPDPQPSPSFVIYIIAIKIHIVSSKT
jgi:hypothetical protein